MAAPLLKDLIDIAFIKRLGAACRQLQPAFNVTEFESLVLNNSFAELELKARIRRVANFLYQHLGLPFTEA
ncbi:MAG: DNA alkylation repair protein, partial [Gammaproteobacteria bacterium]|nr:DNA alkylation repair protein [Gammaproteobacteria bacterium]